MTYESDSVSPIIKVTIKRSVSQTNFEIMHRNKNSEHVTGHIYDVFIYSYYPMK